MALAPLTQIVPLTPKPARDPTGGHVYNLSTWLNGGITPAQVAAWAGYSVAVLLKIYAWCLVDSRYVPSGAVGLAESCLRARIMRAGRTVGLVRSATSAASQI